MEIIYRNDLRENIMEMKSQGVGVIVNLLSQFDLRVIGLKLSEYEQICQEMGIELITFPVQSMKPPADPAPDFNTKLLGIY